MAARIVRWRGHAAIGLAPTLLSCARMHSRLLVLALFAAACSSTSFPRNDAQPPSEDGGPVGADGPADASERLDLPVDLWNLTWTTTTVADASVTTRQITVLSSGGLYFHETNGAPIDASMTAGERDAFALLINRAGVLAELRSPASCGPPGADYTENLLVYQPEGSVQKEITSCHQPAYDDLRAFLRTLIDAHFRFSAGSCPAPNVWRYMSAGCGAEAHPVCGSAGQDGCAATRCSCTGHTIYGCDYTDEPYAHEGPCRDGGI